MTVLTEQEKRDEQLLQQLREEVAAVTPDPWDKILARVQAETQPKPETETVVPLPQRSRSGGAWRRWVAAAAVFVLAVLGGGFYAAQTPGGVATLDANPSIELTVNKLGRVLSVRARNADAQIVLDELELRNQPLQTAADAIVTELRADGYVSADTNSILVTVEAGKGDARLRDQLAAAVEDAQTDCGLEPAVLAQVLEPDPALEAEAAAMGVSAGKAMLIRQISAQVEELTDDALAVLPINDLNILAASNRVSLGDMTSIGAASTGAYIPYDQAMDAALACCGLDADSVTEVSVRFTLIDGRMVMEFVLSDGEHHYVCSVDARTTELCRLTGDEPLKPQTEPVKPQPRPVRPVTPKPVPMPTPTPTPMPTLTPTPTPTPTPIPAPPPTPTPIPTPTPTPQPTEPITPEQARRIAIAAAGISERDLAAWDVQLDESGAQPVYRVTLTTVYYFHPRYVVTIDQMTGAVVSMENVRQ